MTSSEHRPHSMPAKERVWRLQNLREGYDLVAAVGFWKELHGEDLIEEYADLVEQLEAAQRVVDAARTVSEIEATGTLPDFQPLADALAALNPAKSPNEVVDHSDYYREYME